ncbi:nuclease-related domain-containing protein [Lederbergia graminis]|uniref:Nuclease-related domain-containing protein n=1 Tax=Lederbergia graminis TaxID=735518 RepID=A0ABW0LIN2_9BACI
MIVKQRSKSKELLTLESLDVRMKLLNKDKQYYQSLLKGYEGEVLFDSLVEEKLQCDSIILNDLLLKLNKTTFQIDSLIITMGTIFLNEVKNLEGDYYYESDRLYTKSATEVSNPLTQLIRCESLLRQLLRSLGFNIPIHGVVIFVNPEFTLYKAPLNKPFIFPTQINNYFRQLNKITTKVNKEHRILADKLLSLHNTESPYKQIPAYEYDQLQKGITCIACKSFSVTVEGQRCTCLGCGEVERVENAVIRSVHEYKLLFPSRKVTSKSIDEWCKIINSQRRIKRILETQYTKMGANRWTHYV